MGKKELIQRFSRKLSVLTVLLIIISCFTILPVSAAEGDQDLKVMELSTVTESDALYDNDRTTLYAKVVNNSSETFTGSIEVVFAFDGRIVDTVETEISLEPNGEDIITSEKEALLWFGSHAIKTNLIIEDSMDSLKQRVIVKDEVNPEPQTTTEPPTEATTEPPTGPVSAKLIDDFNRANLYDFNIQTDAVQAISDSNVTLYGADGQAATEASVDNCIGIKSTAAEKGLYFTDAVLEKGETHKYLVIKIKGANGGEEKFLSLTNEYNVSGTARKSFAEYVGPDGANIPAITTAWQYIVIDIEKSGMEYYTYGEDLDVVVSFRSFRINFQLENSDSEVFIDEMYFAETLD